MAVPAVGFFDSGVGGLGVARAFLRLRPSASAFYVADWEFCPYGARPDSEILARVRKITADLAGLGCGIVVMACNSASAVALHAMRAERADLRFVGMEPATKPAAAAAAAMGSAAIGVIATAHTLAGGLFRETAARHAPGLRVETVVGEGFVELAEAGDVSSDAARAAVRKVLAPLLLAGCNPIVLGCTHYPILLPLLREEAPGVEFIDPAEAVAKRVAAVWDELVRPADIPPPTTPPVLKRQGIVVVSSSNTNTNRENT